MKTALTLFFAVVSISFSSGQTKVAGVNLPNDLSIEGEKLVLNGSGVREKYWMDMYAAGLYLKSRSSDAKAIVAANEPMAIRLHIVSGLITSDNMKEAVNEGFKNSTNGNTSGISSEIEKFKEAFSEEITGDDVFDIAYIPNKGVLIYKNGKRIEEIKGLEFKKAVFGIWLSDKPAGEDLKKGLLGKK